MTKKFFVCVSMLALGVWACGCESKEEGEGTLGATVWGEEFIEERIPADEFADGYALTYNTFLINLGEIKVAHNSDDAPALVLDEMAVWDLTQPGPLEIGTDTTSAGAFANTEYRIGPATSATVAGNATDEQVQMMIDGGLSVYVEGRAQLGDMEKTFRWGFSLDTSYDHCESTAVLKEGGEAAVQITIHGDHLFYDDAVSSEPSLRFNDFALADTDDDGEITQEELEAYSITPLDNYGVGNLDIEDLWSYVEHMTTTLGHIDGEGHCHFH